MMAPDPTSMPGILNNKFEYDNSIKKGMNSGRGTTFNLNELKERLKPSPAGTE